MTEAQLRKILETTPLDLSKPATKPTYADARGWGGPPDRDAIPFVGQRRMHEPEDSP